MNKAKKILDKHSSKNDRVEFGEFGVMVKMSDAIRAIEYAQQQVKNNDLLHSVSESSSEDCEDCEYVMYNDDTAICKNCDSCITIHKP